MPYRVINIYYSVTCYTNHINSTRIQSIASMALMVFPDGTTGDGSKIDKCVIQADRNMSQVQKYLSLLSFDSPFTKREGCGKKYTIFGALARTLFTSLLTSWKAVCQLYTSKGMARWLGSSHDSMVEFGTLACVLLLFLTMEDLASKQ